ncbi:MAG: GNAT family N-acetyltransferase [Clostridia bacterium]
MIEIEEFKFDSDIYQRSLRIRNEVLRLPIWRDLFNEDLSGDKKSIHVGAFDEGKMVGVVLMDKAPDSIIRLRQFAVRPFYQGKGIGTLLEDYCEKYAKRNGIKILTVHARKEAIEFYKKCGFVAVGDEFEEVGIPHYEMYKAV